MKINPQRRIRIDLLSPAETAIRNAMLAVEGMAADPSLTDAVVLLGQAQNKVAEVEVNAPDRGLYGC